MTEFLPENNDPVCQAAKVLLAKIKGDWLVPDRLYPLQLMLWGLSNAGLEPSLAESLEPPVSDLLRKPPQAVLSWLLYPEQTKLHPTLEPKALKELSPEDAARELLDLLADRLAATSEWSPPKQARQIAV